MTSVHLLSNNELLSTIKVECGQKGYAECLRQKLKCNPYNLREILLSELKYIRGRVEVQSILKTLFLEGKPLPRGCIQEPNGFCSVYFKSFTLNGRWNPSYAYNDEDEDSVAYENLINGLKEMNIDISA